MTHTPPAKPRAFVHPLWWTALVLLVTNDHVFKAAGVLPAALTGKLSDFAGMIVAPPLLAVGLQRTALTARAARTIAALLVGAGLCAIKLSPHAAHALEAAFGRIGLAWRICVDASDVWALLVLPLGYALSRPARASGRERRARELAHPLGIAIASLACIATGLSNKNSSSSSRSDAPTIQNHSGRTVSLVLAATEGSGGCRIYRDDRIGLLTADAFTSAREVVVAPDEEASLIADNSTATCGAASIALANGQQQLVFWRDLEKIEGFVPNDDTRRVARRIVLDGKPDHYTFAIGDDLQAFELGQAAPKSNCTNETDAADTLAFTAPPVAQGFVQLGERRTAADGCIEVDWFMVEGDTTPKTQSLCVPDWAFPFAQDETLALTQTVTDGGSRSLRITRYNGSSLDTQLEIWNEASEFEGSQIKALAAIDCVGTISSCGAYVRPIEASLRGSSKLLHAGDDHTLNFDHPDKGDPKSTRVLIGNARDVSWTSATCSGAETQIGTSANALELREY